MSLPRFVVAGVPKAGTTSLYEYLDVQPGVFVSDIKEINFLSFPGDDIAQSRYPRMRFPITTAEAYDELFAPAGARVPVDFSPSCFRSDVAVERIKRFVPDAGLILVLRDPVSRAWSAYQHRIRKGYERRDAEAALVADDPVVQMGFYSDRVAELQQVFGASKVAVWLFDDFRADTEGTVSEILRHIGAQPAESVALDGRVHNAARLPKSRTLHRLFPDHAQRRAILRRVPRGALRPIEWVYRANQRPGDDLPESIAVRLRALYADDVVRLQEILQRDLTAWLAA